jgi:hypothetical protein
MIHLIAGTADRSHCTTRDVAIERGLRDKSGLIVDHDTERAQSPPAPWRGCTPQKVDCASPPSIAGSSNRLATLWAEQNPGAPRVSSSFPSERTRERNHRLIPASDSDRLT